MKVRHGDGTCLKTSSSSALHTICSNISQVLSPCRSTSLLATQKVKTASCRWPTAWQWKGGPINQTKANWTRPYPSTCQDWSSLDTSNFIHVPGNQKLQSMVWRREKPIVWCSFSPAMTAGAMRKSPMSLNTFAPNRFPLTLRFCSCQKKQPRGWLGFCSNCPWVCSWDRNKWEARLGVATMEGIQPVDWDEGRSVPQKKT